MWGLILAATIAATGQATIHSDYQAARAHRASIPANEHGYYYYVTTAYVPEIYREKQLRSLMGTVMCFQVCSTSRSVYLEEHAPKQLTDTMWVIDLRALQWDYADFIEVAKRNPYGGWCMMLRADWLTHELADAQESDAYYKLLYGSKNIPKTRDEFLKFWKVSQENADLIPFIEGDSGVALAKRRWLEKRGISHPISYAWGTRDTARHEWTTADDPLEFPDGAFRHAAEEWIVGIPKYTYEERGVLQAYLLSDDQGNIQNAAPVSIVEDTTRFRDLAEIRTMGSCVQCHPQGINAPTLDDFRQNYLGGDPTKTALTYQDEKKWELTKRLYGGISQLVENDSNYYQIGVKLVTGGWTGIELTTHYKFCIDWYDQPVTLEQAALEMGCGADELSQALGYYQPIYLKKYGKGFTRALANLPSGAPVFRRLWEENWTIAAAAVSAWQDRHEGQAK